MTGPQRSVEVGVAPALDVVDVESCTGRCKFHNLMADMSSHILSVPWSEPRRVRFLNVSSVDYFSCMQANFVSQLALLITCVSFSSGAVSFSIRSFLVWLKTQVLTAFSDFVRSVYRKTILTFICILVVLIVAW